MRSLDTLPLLRPKAEAGRAPSGEDPHAGAAPGFEAMLGALENGTAPIGEAAAEPVEADTDMPALPAAGPGLDSTADPAGSALQALMALAVPLSAPAAVVPVADAGLGAMVQRAAARAGTGPNPAPAEPAVSIARVGLETHFAPVRPHGTVPSTAADTVREAHAPASRTALPATGGTAGTATVVPREDHRPSPPRAATAAEATAPARVRTDRPDEPLPPGADAVPFPPPRGGIPDPVARPARPVPARDPLPTAAPAPVSGLPEAAVAPRAPIVRAASAPEARTGPVDATAAEAAPPASPLPGQDRPLATAAAAQPPAVAAAMQTVGADPLRTPVGRGRTAPPADPAEPPATSEAAPSPAGPTADADLTASEAAPRRVTAGQARRDPEPSQERAAGLTRSEPVAARAPAPMPRAEADRGNALSAESAESAEPDPAPAGAPRPDLSLAGPVPQAASAPAPVPASPLRQIVDAVAAQLPAAPAAQARPLPASAEAGPLKILTLQLHPAELGSVLVRMRLQDGRLEMSLRTSREETAERLRKEGDLLSGLLREAGYEPEAVTIQAGGAGPGESGPRGQGFASFGAQGGQHDRQPGAATPDQSGRRPSPRADTAAMPTEEQDHETEIRGRDRGGLYL